MQNKSHFTSSADQPQQPVGQSSRTQSNKTLWKSILRFMVQRPQASAQSSIVMAKDRYSAKASLYPYLPASEEQRDWLERIYHDQ
ncbi:hypothetical protein [cf. Phormidesmis sp. LEGE 11477]|uniref:hypothetical protein n=1 Tax=cf. Phormidesmis sp. LEGE 11477 TaxID=1828680 RepID=UPI00187E1267|nr:hypothetical protein [cf. Phormidesmis sp. LEGE 11477]MBE9059632.1 hypothetical protein [cf. Phormidesmis sp. LEGE 11477]